MYRIGICDREKSVCSSIEEMILYSSGLDDVHVEIESWNMGENLCNYLKESGQIDILFLGIELCGMSGMDVGHYIRNVLEDRRMQIVYLSGKSSCAQMLFRTQPMEFLLKPIGQKQIDRCLELAIKLIGQNEERFFFQNGKKFYYIPYREIWYFSSEGRKIRITSDRGEMEFYGKLCHVLMKLPKQFIVIHKSYVVNRDKVYCYSYETIELSAGIILPISKIYRKQVRNCLLGDK